MILGALIFSNILLPPRGFPGVRMRIFPGQHSGPAPILRMWFLRKLSASMLMTVRKQMKMKTQTATLCTCLGLILISAGTLRADPFITTLDVGPQSPGILNPGASATFVITLTKTGSGNLEAYLSSFGLPTGAAASFSPTSVVFTGGNATQKSATLTVTTTASTPIGTYTFYVVSRDGNSLNTITNTGTLTVGVPATALPAPPVITSITRESDQSILLAASGNANQTYSLQATLDLANPSWTTISTTAADANGLFSFVDVDAKSYSSRFYRLVNH